LHILIAEDNPTNQKLMQHVLSKLGYSADVVADGGEALAAVDRERYDVVFMDVQMPAMDGLTATRRIRETIAEDRRPQIIAMTANAMQGDREACLAAGMDDYVSKPIRIQDVVQALLRSPSRCAIVEPLPSAPAVSSPRG
jgi:CheY-like chemotaxis protein